LSLLSFKISSPKIVHETIDGEVVIINLESGFYYSIQNVGTIIWEKAIAGFTVAEILKYLNTNFEASSKDIEIGVYKFLEHLQSEAIVISTETQSGMTNQIAHSTPTHKLAFELPTLQKYTDMESLLLLDPVHEVDETGWPSQPSDRNSNQVSDSV